mmetsp:Transcript_8863/g.29213  ORF Transcript_8863/g.29213 Transcript_8863/m.29213 type:complete len:248 (+) Transcript_8863:283-1026(+)
MLALARARAPLSRAVGDDGRRRTEPVDGELSEGGKEDAWRLVRRVLIWIARHSRHTEACTNVVPICELDRGERGGVRTALFLPGLNVKVSRCLWRHRAICSATRSIHPTPEKHGSQEVEVCVVRTDGVDRRVMLVTSWRGNLHRSDNVRHAPLQLQGGVLAKNLEAAGRGLRSGVWKARIGKGARARVPVGFIWGCDAAIAEPTITPLAKERVPSPPLVQELVVIRVGKVLHVADVVRHRLLARQLS